MSTSESLSSKFENIDWGCFRFIVLYESEDRKKLHQYLEEKYPKLHKSSLLCRDFRNKNQRYFKECMECNNKNIKMKYRYGMEKNNSDEYYSIECLQCGWFTTIDCSDVDRDNSKYVEYNNIVAFGNYFKGFTKSNVDKANITDQEIAEILKDKKVYEINNPIGSLNKKKLGEYISNGLKE